MDEQATELLRTLQSGVHDGASFARIEALLPLQRASLAKADDRATLADISELLELWAQEAPGSLGGKATEWAAAIAESDLGQAERAVQLYQLCLEREPLNVEPLAKLDTLLRERGAMVELERILAEHARRLCATEGADPGVVAGVFRRLGDLRAERCKAGGKPELNAAIEAYEQALDLAVDTDILLILAELYERRGADGDAAQAAEFFCTLGDVLGEVEGLPMVERALDRWPAHDAAIDLLETYIPAPQHAAKLQARWAAYIEHSENEVGTDARRLSLARAHAAEGRDREALICMAPLCDKGEGAALSLQATCLASLRSAEQRQSQTEAAAVAGGEAVAVRPATLVGFRIPSAELEQASESSGPDTESAEPARVPTRSARVARDPTLVGFGLPHLAADGTREDEHRVVADAETAEVSSSPLQAETSAAAVSRNEPRDDVASTLRDSTADAGNGPLAKAAALRARMSQRPSASPSSAPPGSVVPGASGPMAKAAALRAGSSPGAIAAPSSQPPIRPSVPPPLSLAPKVAPVRIAAAHDDTAPAIAKPAFVAPRVPLPVPEPDVVARPSAGSMWSEPRWRIGGAVGVVVVGGALAWLMRSDPAPASTGAAYAKSRVDSIAPTAPVQAAPTPAPVAPTPVAAPVPTPAAVAAPTQSPKPSHGTLKPGKLSVRGGKLTVQQVKLALDDNMAGMEKCYDTALSSAPQLHGVLTFAWTIEKTGRPSHVRTLKGNVKDDGLEKCSLGELKKARFPKPKKKSAEVNWPVTYRKG